MSQWQDRKLVKCHLTSQSSSPAKNAGWTAQKAAPPLISTVMLTKMESKITKSFLGVLTIGTPIILIMATFVLPDFINSGNKDYLFKVRETIKIISLIVLGVLFVFYFLFSLLSNNVPKDKKYLWAALLFFGHLLVMPFFWYKCVWKRNAT